MCPRFAIRKGVKVLSRLDIMTPSRAQTVIDGLYRDVERRIAASPPGLCPVDLAMNFLNLCHAQTCGKCTPCAQGMPKIEALLGDGSQYGIHLQYKVQPSPDGLAQAFILGEEFIGDDCCAMILGDNIFYGNGFSKILKTAAANAETKGRCTVFGYYVQDPERFGIVEFDQNGKVLSVEEKPEHPKSNYAITGLYFYNKEVVQMAKQVKPSARGELEITTLNDMYLKKDELDVQLLGRGYAWLDTGTMDSLVEAATFVQTVEQRQGIKISAPEEIAYKYGWITKEKLLESAARYGKSPYGQHLKNVADGKLRY